MPRRVITRNTCFAIFLSLLGAVSVARASGKEPRTTNTPRTFPKIGSRQQWETRAEEIREQILVSCGLWPMPAKTPLDAKIFGRISHPDYTVEKVYMRTIPGFYLAGNLYRPAGKAKGPFPGILNPHGHWKEGRLADTTDGSIAARCITFARQGMVAFSYDMVGYNDTRFANSPTNKADYDRHRAFDSDPRSILWNISTMGLQTWNSIRALDFLESLPDVDKTRLACTGESGGGTQTFMLGAIEKRLAVQAPVVMVSHSMQGGCSCENAPGLRCEFSNMEISAAAAPRPQILIAASGDWTKTTMEIEGPQIAHIYDLLGVRDRFGFQRFEFNHNYNKTSREAVYQFFGKVLLPGSSSDHLREQPYQKEPDSDLRVFPDQNLPADALTMEQFTEQLRKLHRDAWQKLLPHDSVSLASYKKTFMPAWRRTVQLNGNFGNVRANRLPSTSAVSRGGIAMEIRKSDNEPSISAVLTRPASKNTPRTLAVCFANQGVAADAGPPALCQKLLAKGISVLRITEFSEHEATNQLTNFFCTYNFTKLQSRVNDLAVICAAMEQFDPETSYAKIGFIGSGTGGLWALAAAPLGDFVIADCAGLDGQDDNTLLAPDLFCPGIQNLGGFQGIALLAAPNPIFLHNTGKEFGVASLQTFYGARQTKSKARVLESMASDDDIADYLVSTVSNNSRH